MQEAVPRAAALVPAAISALALFVVVVAGSTIAFLGWRASRRRAD